MKQRKKCKTITDEEFHKLLASLDPVNKLMIYSLVNLCCRVSEIDNLTLKDLIKKKGVTSK